MTHSFNVEIASEYGIEEAILIQNFAFWIGKNSANKTSFFEGRYWTSHTLTALFELFPEFKSIDKTKRILKRLIDVGVLTKGNFNKTPMDRTCWYAFTDKGLDLVVRFGIFAQCIVQKSTNGNGKTAQSKRQNCQSNTIDITKDSIDPPLYISPLTGENISPQGEKSKTEVEVEEVEVEEAKPKKPKVKIEKNPLNMDCVPEDLADVVNTWLNYKKEKQQTYKQSGFNAMVKKLIAYSGGDPQIAQQIVDNAMAANYMGFFPLKNNGQQQINPIVDVIHGAVEMSLKREMYEKQRNQQQQSNLCNDIF